MAIQRRVRRDEEAENPFWITYSDLLSSLVMVFLILVMAFQAISMLQAQKLKENQKQLEEQKKNLEQELKQKQALSAKVDALKIQQHAEQLEKLVKRLSKLQKRFPDVQVDHETGEVKISEKILFKSGRTEVLPAGRKFLKEFMPEWAAVVTDPEYKDIVKQVVFEGHADPVGAASWDQNYLDNLNLTLVRSEAVTRYVFSGSCGLGSKLKERLRKLVSAAGRSNIESLASVTEQHPDWKWDKIRKTNVGGSRSVSLKLTFNNPLLRWDQAGTGGEHQH